MPSELSRAIRSLRLDNRDDLAMTLKSMRSSFRGVVAFVDVGNRVATEEGLQGLERGIAEIRRVMSAEAAGVLTASAQEPIGPSAVSTGVVTIEDAARHGFVIGARIRCKVELADRVGHYGILMFATCVAASGGVERQVRWMSETGEFRGCEWWTPRELIENAEVIPEAEVEENCEGIRPVGDVQS